MDGNVAESLRMLEAFRSVGVKCFSVSQTDVNGNDLKPYWPGVNVAGMKLLLADAIPRAWVRSTNLILRPVVVAGMVFAQLDDLDAGKLQSVLPVAFLTVETSPGNYQAWIAIDADNATFAFQLAKSMKADLGASRAVRVSGSPNCKRKYAPHFPTVRIHTVTAGLIVKPEALEHLITEPPPPPLIGIRGDELYHAVIERGRAWPDHPRCIAGAPLKADGSPDRSRADFIWSKLALKFGHSVDAVITKLMELSAKAREQGEKYARRTVESAAKAW